MKRILLTALILWVSAIAFANRETYVINQEWMFRFSHQVTHNTQRVDLPHTWNAQDALSGKHDYKRGIGNYTKRLFIKSEWQGRRLFLFFEGANSVSNLFINGKHIGEHRGGYGAFVFEITKSVDYGKENEILVRVNNGEQLDVMPLVGDFNFYGGIYRDVHLLVTDAVCISPLDYASSGVYLIQNRVNEKQADVCSRVVLSNNGSRPEKALLKLKIKDGDKVVLAEEKEILIAPHTNNQTEQIEFSLKNPHLWNGTEDPFMYQAEVTLWANGKEQLRELIRQNYNHPSICFWGLFNELKEIGDNPIEYVKELNELAHKEDTTRPTTSASNQEGAINFLTDLIAWNKYDGWYGATPATLASWLDSTHKKHPDLKIGLSEYGAGASVYHQQDSLVQTVPNSWWHPENWQTEYHIRNWEIISSRPFIWGSFVWNMFDFGAAHRTEGDRPGINDKGLVTHDRKVKKDAFYFYKANWNPSPMVYIEGHRNINRQRPITDVRVFSNCPEAVLKVNGMIVGKVKPDSLKVCMFKDVLLQKGENTIEVSASAGKKCIVDSCTWNLE